MKESLSRFSFINIITGIILKPLNYFIFAAKLYLALFADNMLFAFRIFYISADYLIKKSLLNLIAANLAFHYNRAALESI